MSEYCVERTGAAGVARGIGRKVRQLDAVSKRDGRVGLRGSDRPVVVLGVEAGDDGIGRGGVEHREHSRGVGVRRVVAE